MQNLPKHLKDEWTVLHERVYSDTEFQRILDAYYKDPNKRIELQHWITQRRLKVFRNLDPEKNYILERSFFGDMVFCHLNLVRHEKPNGEFISYYYDVLKAMRECKYDLVLYLKSTPDRCYVSMNGRGRKVESEVPLKYLQDLHSFYECVMPQAIEETETNYCALNWNNFGKTYDVAGLIQEKLEEGK